ncbi:Acetyltransferase sirH [Hypsizygus marmoreus]|uniref:Acetyltransferase sirH n=1 Tax=Hypsizygus marmoreus TaxID=39966 RepID=A0A369K0D1_HYPMA|nr:Acetyltransferase sirH [Hypsizygus marmoreus]
MASPNVPFVLLILVLFASLYTHNSKDRLRPLFFPILVLLYFYIVIYTSTSVPATNYNIGLQSFLLLLLASDYLLLTPSLQHTLIRRGSLSPPKSSNEQFAWALDLITNPRGVNWSFEAPRLRRSSLPRWAFVRSQLLWAFVFYIFKDVLFIHLSRNPAFDPDGVGMRAGGWLWRIWNVWAFWMTFASEMSLYSTLLGVSCVVSGLWEPQDCPFFFGHWTEAVSVRAFWGRTWHQVLRHTLTTHGRYFANTILHLPRGSLLSTYTQLVVVFFLSGIFHSSAEWVLSHNPQFAFDAVAFYTLQALAIMVEDGVAAIGKRIGVRDTFAVKLFGMAWLALWMAWSGPLWMDPMIKGRMLATMGPSASVVERFLGAFNSFEFAR